MILRKIFSFPTLTLLVALTLSAIAAWYSVLGLTAIFAAAVIPIIIMGGSLEVAKVVTTLWLHKYWDRATWKLKLYLIPAVMALAFLTSMGIFGFLSKAHSDQSLVSGDAGARIELIDEKIKISRENIAMSQQALEQMNSQVDQLLGRTDDDRGANRAVQVRRQQRAERTRIQEEIAQEQAIIASLNEEAAPIRAEIRQIEAEVGPIKYIAAMIYGDNPDSNLLERAVRWVIILIVLVFDPLALVLVLASQSSYRWLDDDLRNRRKEKEDEEKFKEAFLNTKLDEETTEFLDEVLADVPNETPYEDEEKINDTQYIQTDIEQPNELVREDVYETSPSATDAPGPSMDQIQTGVEEPEDVVITEGVTLRESEGGYVQHNGKAISKNALAEMYPGLAARPDVLASDSANFGIQFPRFSQKGSVFVRVDMIPNRVYKFDGNKWIELNKEQTDAYLYDEEYIRHLISKIETGEYDLDLLSSKEKSEIEDYLNKISKS